MPGSTCLRKAGTEKTIIKSLMMNVDVKQEEGSFYKNDTELCLGVTPGSRVQFDSLTFPETFTILQIPFLLANCSRHCYMPAEHLILLFTYFKKHMVFFFPVVNCQFKKIASMPHPSYSHGWPMRFEQKSPRDLWELFVFQIQILSFISTFSFFFLTKNQMEFRKLGSFLEIMRKSGDLSYRLRTMKQKVSRNLKC